MILPTVNLYFAIYINVDGMSAQKAQEILSQAKAYLEKNTEESPNKEIFFVFGVRNQPTKMELLYPSLNGLSSDELDKLHESFISKLNKIKHSVIKM